MALSYGGEQLAETNSKFFKNIVDLGLTPPVL